MQSQKKIPKTNSLYPSALGNAYYLRKNLKLWDSKTLAMRPRQDTLALKVLTCPLCVNIRQYIYAIIENTIANKATVSQRPTTMMY